MSVSDTVVLPAQPAEGSSVYLPLGGGDGWTAPLSAYSVLHSLTMDASGGVASIATTFDARFENILVSLAGLTTGVAGAQDFQEFLIQDQPPAAGHRARAFGEGIQTGISDECIFNWAPPLILFQNRCVTTAPNTDNGILHQFAWIFCFNIRVFEKVPLNIILGSIPSIQGQNVTA